jgi:hypothetical protein
MHVSYKGTSCELLEDNEYSDISESECSSSEINVQILSYGEQVSR